ncbi:unnamed protein product [Brassica rapa]|uniref:Uncharacterized protein n=2 Tax=Brassica campestris TaxID=3711 RepID=A0A8D9CPT4_BRACM|nr:unnamed protein product [Brassica rapa]
MVGEDGQLWSFPQLSLNSVFHCIFHCGSSFLGRISLFELQSDIVDEPFLQETQSRSSKLADRGVALVVWLESI